MKKNVLFFKIFGILFLLSIILNSCDKIDEPYTTKVVFEPSKKKILLEEFTGHKCTNCPEAHTKIHELLETYHNQIIVIGMHEVLSLPDTEGEFNNDYRTTEGESLKSFYVVDYAPSGIINRTRFKTNNYVLNKNEWQPIIDSLLKTKAGLELNIKNQINESNNTISTTIDGKFLTTNYGNFNLCVLITEDSIISAQKTNDKITYPDKIIHNYNHMHVLRKYATDIYGETVATNLVDSTTTFSKSYTINIDPKWKAKNCNVVAFVTNKSTKEVIQAECKKAK